MKITLLKPIFLVALMSVFALGCDDEEPEELTGNLTLELTDAPADHENVNSIVITVGAIAVDGELVTNFEPKTIEVSSLVEGKTTVLAESELDIGNYSNVSLLLDHDSTTSGESPGCYAVLDNGSKVRLSDEGDSFSEIVLSENVEVGANSEQSFVVDFDLRKTIRYEGTDKNTAELTLVNDDVLSSAIRIENKQATGSVQGELSGNIGLDEKVVIYAYRKGEYDSSETEKSAVEGNLRFSNAVTSSAVNADGTYTLSFLEEGDYEVHAAKYKTNSDGSLTFDGKLTLGLIGGIALDNTISVNANTTLDLNLELG